MDKLLSILIPTLTEREKSFKKLFIKLSKQIIRDNLPVEIIPLENNGENKIGFYRNELMKQAKGKYLLFCDDDDDIHHNFLRMICEALEEDIDCVGFKVMVEMGDANISMICSNENLKYINLPDLFVRPITHIQIVRTEIGRKFLFDETMETGSDVLRNTEMAKYLKDKNEVYLDNYLYIYKPNFLKQKVADGVTS